MDCGYWLAASEYIWVRIGLREDRIGKACNLASRLRHSKIFLGSQGGKVQEVTKTELGESWSGIPEFLESGIDLGN